MYTLNFSNGQSQTYPDAYTMEKAARAMGGKAEVVNLGQKIYVFVPKK